MTTELWPVPASWTWTAFRDVADVELELVDAKRFPEAVHIAPNHIESSTGRLLGMGTVAGDRVAGPKHRFECGHVLYSKIRPYLAKAVIAPCAGFCSSDMYPLRARFSREFLLNWLVSSAFTRRVSRDQNRTVLPKVNLATLRELPVPVAPLNEQRRIVAKLEALQAHSGRAREALDAVPPLLEKLRQSILAAAFRGDLTKDWRAKQKDIEPATELLQRIRAERREKWEATELAKLKSKGKPPTDDKWKAAYTEPQPVRTTGLPELPEYWCWASAEELLVDGPSNGFSPKSDSTGSGTLTLKLSATTRGYCRLTEETTKRTVETISFDAPYWLSPGDVLVQRANTIEYVGVSAIFNGPERTYIYPDLMMRLRASPSVGPQLLWRALSWDFCRKFMRDRATGTAGNMPKVNGETVRSIPIPIPPITEQAQLWSLLETCDRVQARLEDILAATLYRAGALDRTLLAKAFRGELVPQDPNDEPAEAMLARARSTNGSTPANGSPPKRGRARTAKRAEQPND